MDQREKFFQLMNMSRAARRAYQKKFGVKIPGIQDSSDVPITPESEEKAPLQEKP